MQKKIVTNLDGRQRDQVRLGISGRIPANQRGERDARRRSQLHSVTTMDGRRVGGRGKDQTMQTLEINAPNQFIIGELT